MTDHMISRLVTDESGHGLWVYALVTGFFSVLVFQPELIAAAVYRVADLLHLFLSQVNVVF